jgi:hypothetical protein
MEILRNSLIVRSRGKLFLIRRGFQAMNCSFNQMEIQASLKQTSAAGREVCASSIERSSYFFEVN